MQNTIYDIDEVETINQVFINLNEQGLLSDPSYISVNYNDPTDPVSISNTAKITGLNYTSIEPLNFSLNNDIITCLQSGIYSINMCMSYTLSTTNIANTISFSINEENDIAVPYTYVLPKPISTSETLYTSGMSIVRELANGAQFSFYIRNNFGATTTTKIESLFVSITSV